MRPSIGVPRKVEAQAVAELEAERLRSPSSTLSASASFARQRPPLTCCAAAAPRCG
jgi:hypothetical protein